MKMWKNVNACSHSSTLESLKWSSITECLGFLLCSWLGLQLYMLLLYKLTQLVQSVHVKLSVWIKLDSVHLSFNLTFQVVWFWGWFHKGAKGGGRAQHINQNKQNKKTSEIHLPGKMTNTQRTSEENVEWRCKSMMLRVCESQANKLDKLALA